MKKIEKFITQEMMNEYWSINKNLLGIPEKFITEEMVNEYFGK